jgi:predicted MFS family arabinose efflux permease
VTALFGPDSVKDKHDHHPHHRCQQGHRSRETEPAHLEQIGGAIVTVRNVGIAAGAVIGGIVVDGAAASTPLLIGGTASILGAVVLVTRRSAG